MCCSARTARKLYFFEFCAYELFRRKKTVSKANLIHTKYKYVLVRTDHLDKLRPVASNHLATWSCIFTVICRLQRYLLFILIRSGSQDTTSQQKIRFIAGPARSPTVRLKWVLHQVDVQIKHAQNDEHFNSTKRNNIKDGLVRCTTGIPRLLLDVSWSSCSLSNLLASHSSQLLALFHVLFVQALQTSGKTTAIWLVICVIGRAKKK